MATADAVVAAGGHFLGHILKPVKVELPNEARELAVLKVLWQIMLFQLRWAVNKDGVTGIVPASNPWVQCTAIFDHSMGFRDKVSRPSRFLGKLGKFGTRRG